MSRPFSGKEHLAAARHLRDHAQNAQQLRQALAVLLPLEQGLTLAQTAAALGRSRRATCSMRTRFCAEQRQPTPVVPSKKQMRNRALTTLQEEASILDAVLVDSSQGGVLVVSHLKPLVEQKLGKSICTATLYNMLHRHGWRKLAPDTMHPQGSAEVREEWKKNSPRPLRKRSNASP